MSIQEPWEQTAAVTFDVTVTVAVAVAFAFAVALAVTDTFRKAYKALNKDIRNI